jgi:hypothetical protein
VVALRRYQYVGPAELRSHVVAVDAIAVDTVETLGRWLASRITASSASRSRSSSLSTAC